MCQVAMSEHAPLPDCARIDNIGTSAILKTRIRVTSLFALGFASFRRERIPGFAELQE